VTNRISAVLGVVILAMVFGAASCTSSAEFKSQHAEPPLATINVTVDAGRAKEVFARVAPGVRIEKVIDLGIFDGFDPRMTLDAARSRLGSPTGEWSDPFCGEKIAFYDRPQGKVSLCRYPTSGQPAWATVGYPRQCDPGRVFTDARILPQILPWLPASDGIDVHLQPSSGPGGGGVTLNMKTTGCLWVVLERRE